MEYDKKKFGFFEDVYAVVRQIPHGRVTSYRAIACYLGTARSARMVGWALNNCHGLTDVPAHRVVNRNGQLSGKKHFETLNTMQNKLAAEGIHVKEEQVQDFSQFFWDPAQELCT